MSNDPAPVTRRTALQALAGAQIAVRGTRPRPSKPNIVILLADDLGHGDVGFTGCPDIRTPHLDQLAAEGVRFTHAYANGPVCSPTRAALLTGQYQQRNGVGDVLYADQRDRGLPLKALLIPEALKQHGYATGLFGKWHLGYPKEFFPTRQGFDEFIGFVAGNIDYFAHTDRLGQRDLWKREEALRDRRYMTRLIADESIAFIDRRRDQPFFLYVPFSAPHAPFQGPEDKKAAGNRAMYRKMVEYLDFSIGRILEHLKKRELEENTVVFFMSDNGGVPGVGRNAPFRGFKGSLWEGGIRTPFLARWKGEFPAGVSRPEVIAGMDLFSTCLAAAQAPLPLDRAIDGVSFLHVCRGEDTLPPRMLCFNYQAPNQPAQRAMVRRGWKYLLDNKGQEYLFHLDKDEGETENLAAKEPERLAEMREYYEFWLKDVSGTLVKPAAPPPD
ncbi:MAG: sulfatase-like hydrolase/transferase [Acidobacteriota bacterium]